MPDKRWSVSLGQAVTVLANLGVLVGLIFVVAELQQNRVALQAEIELDLAAAYQTTIGRGVDNASVVDLLQTAFLTPDSLSQAELTRLMGWSAEWMAVVYATYRLRELGAVDDEVWQQHGSYFALFFQTPWMREFWRSTSTGVYPDDFMAELETLMPTRDLRTELGGYAPGR